jgi:orotate phosphoribosyltransferase-like protein
MSQVLWELAIGMLTTGMSTRAVARELNVNFSTINVVLENLAVSPYRPHNRRPRVWLRVGKRFANINIVNRVPHGGGGVMVWAGIIYGQ